MTRDELILLARKVADQHGLHQATVCAIAEQESDWDPWATRYEPAFYIKYIQSYEAAHAFDITEGRGRAFSWGLGQVMGQTAREHGYKGPLAAICDPQTGLDLLCTVYAHKASVTSGNMKAALAAYNGGSNLLYADQVVARMGKYS
jgi:soluble lytic murein transglycosylase-like protein